MLRLSLILKLCDTQIFLLIFESQAVDLSAADTFLRYSDTGISAGVWREASSWKTVTFGFPLETVESRSHRDALFRGVLRWFDKQ